MESIRAISSQDPARPIIEIKLARSGIIVLLYAEQQALIRREITQLHLHPNLVFGHLLTSLNTEGRQNLRLIPGQLKLLEIAQYIEDLAEELDQDRRRLLRENPISAAARDFYYTSDGKNVAHGQHNGETTIFVEQRPGSNCLLFKIQMQRDLYAAFRNWEQPSESNYINNTEFRKADKKFNESARGTLREMRPGLKKEFHPKILRAAYEVILRPGPSFPGVSAQQAQEELNHFAEIRGGVGPSAARGGSRSGSVHRESRPVSLHSGSGSRASSSHSLRDIRQNIEGARAYMSQQPRQPQQQDTSTENFPSAIQQLGQGVRARIEYENRIGSGQQMNRYDQPVPPTSRPPPGSRAARTATVGGATQAMEQMGFGAPAYPGGRHPEYTRDPQSESPRDDDDPYIRSWRERQGRR